MREEAAATVDSETADTPPDSRGAIGLLVAGTLVLVLQTARVAFDSDAWWHLRVGEWMLDEHRLPRSDMFSWTAQGDQWRLNSWLYDVVAATLESIGGRAIVSMLMLAALAAFVGTVYHLCCGAGGRPLPSALSALLAGFIATPFLAERPQALSFVLFAVTVIVVERALAGSNRALIGLIALFVFWANLHFAFMSGVLVVALIAGGTAVSHRQLLRPAIVCAAVLVAGLCTPYGIGAYTAALEVRGASHAVEIQEWLPIDPRVFSLFVASCAIELALLGMIRTGRWRRLEIVTPLCVFAVLAVDSRRLLPFAMVLVARELAVAGSRIRLPRIAAYLHSRRAPIGVGLAVAIVVLGVLGGGDLRPVNEQKYPVRGVAALPTGCRVLNEYDHGGYITHTRWPDILVSQDGRNDLYGTERLLEQSLVVNAEGAWLEWIDDHDVDCVLVRPDRPIVAALETEGWTIAVREPSAVLLLRT